MPSYERWQGWEAYIAGLDEAQVRREFLAMCLRSETPDIIRDYEARLAAALEAQHKANERVAEVGKENQRLAAALRFVLDELAGPNGLDVPPQYKPTAERIWQRVSDALKLANQEARE